MILDAFSDDWAVVPLSGGGLVWFRLHVSDLHSEGRIANVVDVRRGVGKRERGHQR